MPDSHTPIRLYSSATLEQPQPNPFAPKTKQKNEGPAGRRGGVCSPAPVFSAVEVKSGKSAEIVALETEWSSGRSRWLAMSLVRGRGI